MLFSRGSAFAAEYVSMVIWYGYVVDVPKPGCVVEVTQQSSMGDFLVVRRIAG
ncbi:hypothetical protein [Streptomyces erythrochromogenes]|uniref:hypothetical protein n=1 Tax=Streptomyces erythrochromogenes TaxID=285574 RepID=UPI0033F4AF00